MRRSRQRMKEKERVIRLKMEEQGNLWGGGASFTSGEWTEVKKIWRFSLISMCFIKILWDWDCLSRRYWSQCPMWVDPFRRRFYFPLASFERWIQILTCDDSTFHFHSRGQLAGIACYFCWLQELVIFHLVLPSVTRQKKNCASKNCSLSTNKGKKTPLPSV